MLLGGSVIGESQGRTGCRTRARAMAIQTNRDDDIAGRSAEPHRRFLVRAKSVNAVRKALHRAPGGARVVGRYDRDTIECLHTMDPHSYRRHWPIIVSR